jgi:hypothetical protein
MWMASKPRLVVLAIISCGVQFVAAQAQKSVQVGVEDRIQRVRSTYEQPLPEDLRKNAAIPYRGDGKPVEGGPHTYPEMAAAGLWTTPTGIAKYLIEVQQSLDGKANYMLNAAMTRNMLTPGIGRLGTRSADWRI